MELTGLLLGAGASHDVAMPLAQELTQELTRWLTPSKLTELNAVWRAQGLGYADDAIETLSGALITEGLSYEHIMGNLEVFNSRVPDHGYHGLLAFLSEIIYFLLKERHVLNMDLIERCVQYLDGIATLAKQNMPLWVFSLNHDLVMECFVAHAGVPMKAGYGQDTMDLPRYHPTGSRIGNLEAHVLRRNQIARGEMDFFSGGENGINLLKIHGSLDEFAFNDGQDLLKLSPMSNSVRGVLMTLQIANEQVRYVDPRLPGGYAAVPNEIVYQDPDGEMQFLRRTPLGGVFKFQPASNQSLPPEVLDRFGTYTNYLTRLVCIGYGFGDQHVNQVIRNWLELSDSRHLTIVDPLSNDVPGLLLHLYHQVDLIDLDATKYLDQVGGISRSRKSELDRRFGSWLRKQGDEAGATMRRHLNDLHDDIIAQTVAWVKNVAAAQREHRLGGDGLDFGRFLRIRKRESVHANRGRRS